MDTLAYVLYYLQSGSISKATNHHAFDGVSAFQRAAGRHQLDRGDHALHELQEDSESVLDL